MRADLLAAAVVVLLAHSLRVSVRTLLTRHAARRLVRSATAQERSSRVLGPGHRRLLFCAVGVLGGLQAFGRVGVVIGGAAGWVAHRAVQAAAVQRESARVERDLPVALETVARILRSGTSPLLAVLEATAALTGPVGDDLRAVAADAERFGLRAATLAWGHRRPEAALAARSLVVALDAGRGAAEGLDSVAITLRERSTINREVRALAAQARLSASVMALTPVGFATLLCGSDPAARQFLLHSPAGVLSLTVGLTLDLAGYRWMRAIAAVQV